MDTTFSPDYWLQAGRLMHRHFSNGGVKGLSQSLYIRLRNGAADRWIKLHTPSQSLAATRAAEFCRDLSNLGYSAARAKLDGLEQIREHPAVLLLAPKQCPATVGEFISAVEALPEQRRVARASTIHAYVRRLRQIAAEIAGIPSDRSKFNYHAKSDPSGAHKWRKLVDAVPLTELTDARVDQWIGKRKKAGTSGAFTKNRLREGRSVDEVAQMNDTTIRSILRDVKSLFSDRIISHVKAANPDMILPERMPFRSLRGVQATLRAYRGEVDAKKVYELAVNELLGGTVQNDSKQTVWQHEIQRVSMFVVVMLGLCAGLRRREIDLLCRADLDLERGYVRVAKTAYFTPKTKSSTREVPLDPRATQLLRTAISRLPASQFVLPGIFDSSKHVGPRYRCQEVFIMVVAWLRHLGINTTNPLHTVRKEFGSQVLRDSDITSARIALGHSSIMLTADCYTFFGKLKPVRPWGGTTDPTTNHEEPTLEAGIRDSQQFSTGEEPLPEPASI